MREPPIMQMQRREATVHCGGLFASSVEARAHQSPRPCRELSLANRRAWQEDAWVMRILVILVLSLVAFWAVQDRMRLSQENSALAARAAAGGRIPDDPRAVKIKQDYQQVLAMFETAMDGAAAAELPALESHAEPSAPLPTVERSAPKNWLQDRIANRKNPLGEVPRLSSPAYRRSPLANIPGAIFPSLRERNDFWD